MASARRRLGRWIFAAAALGAAALAAPPAQAAGRVAVVIVGEDYQKLQKSRVGAKNANDIAEGLRAKGFEVLFGANPTNARARAVLLDFARKADGADLAIAFLLGHVTAAGGQSYFLPVNTELDFATDLFSRGISVSSVARLAGKARAGAVIVLMTTPNFETAVPGLDPRPEYAAETPQSVVTAFSSSAKAPLSGVDALSEQAAGAVVNLLRQPAPSLPDLVRAASADAGAVFGAAAEVSLAEPSPLPDSAATASDLPSNPAAGRPAKPEEAQTAYLRRELELAKVELEKAKLETRRAQAEASRARADAERARAEAGVRLERKEAKPADAPAKTAGVASSPTNQSLSGKRLRQRIQERLRDMGFYSGPIDSVMSARTRDAIMDYQRSRHAQATGYLTPDQFQALLPAGE